MQAPQSRPIKKPRISLSCIVCRRRKVSCGRKQPECANCVRMKETCVYQAMARDEPTGRVRPASPSPQNGHYGGSQSVGTSYTAVPSWKEAIQFPNDPVANPPCACGITATSRGPFEFPETTAYPFPTSTDPNGPRPTLLCRDHLSLRRGGHVRYIGPTFWGFVAGKESLSGDFLDENHHAPPDLPLPHISSHGHVQSPSLLTHETCQ
ncbi:uncharacterized protein N7482_007405 [Penicillium canariense]|uniref:Zn(2)-C6 fungal-type domain-containing protein n=1 Tax=Penicillium canariense TaxID=189055 RepID=A0A9W9HZD9_9EURO|nr:uncharacterized protein N7482_007405 [Penicillium canariense]KAJ5160401.1 hypothetical protein N7482_007405 [Penicillium canariense]